MASIRRAFYTNMCYLMCHTPPLSPHLKSLLSENMFVHQNSNMSGFLEVLYYLLNAWNRECCQEKFKYMWPIQDQKQKSQFLRASCQVIQEIKKNHPDSALPSVTYSFFLQPGGDRFCSTLLRITIFVLNSVFEKDDLMTLCLPKEDSGRGDQIKRFLLAKTESLIRKGIHHHVSSESAVKDAVKFSSKFSEKAKLCAEEQKLVSTELEILLAAKNIPQVSVTRVVNPTDSTALQGWKSQIEVKKDRVQYLVDLLSSVNKDLEQCNNLTNVVLSPSSAHVIDGEKLAPQINPYLASQLSLSEQEIESKLFEGGQLKLQGLFEVGACALKALSAQWAQRSVLAIDAVLPQFEALVDENKKHLDTMNEIQTRYEKMFAKLVPLEAMLLEPVQSEPMPISHFSQVPSGSSLFSLIPCTPPFNFTSKQDKQYSSNDIKRITHLDLDIKVDSLSVDTLIKMWKGEITSLPSSSAEESVLPGNSKPVLIKKCPTSPKRSHSPECPRSSLSQNQYTSAPPPPKDPKLSGMRNRPPNFYTPNFKQALHNRLLQIPGQSVTRSRAHASFTQIGKKETGVTIKTEPLLLSTGKETFSFGKNLSSSENGVITLSDDLDDSLDGNIPLGDVSLQEIASLLLSPFSPLAAPLNCDSSPTVFPHMKPVHESPTINEEDKKPLMDSLIQRLQAIKVKMNEPSTLELTPIQATPARFMRMPIKLELETP